MRIGDRLDGGFESEVFAATTADGRPVVVKLAASGVRAAQEAAVLRIWSGTGVTAELLDADDDDHALLLARIRPGDPMPPSNLLAAADILQVLHAVPLPDAGFPTVEESYPAREKNSVDDVAYERTQRNEPHRGQAGLDRLDAARDLVIRLCRTTTRSVLLHGDFLIKNLLRDGSRYRAIDPMPMIGDPCSDIGFFVAGNGPVSTVMARARTLAIHCGQDPLRAERWAMAWTVLDAVSAWRADQPDLDRFVLGPDAARLLAA